MFSVRGRKPKNPITIMFLLLLLLASPCEAGTATLYKGEAALGEIPVMDGEGGFVISIADAGALLGMEAAVVGEELHLSRGGDKLRIVLNAVAAWQNTQLIPLYSASYVHDGRWWLDVPSSLSLLQRFAGRGGSDRLRVEELQGGSGAGGNALQAARPEVAVEPQAVEAKTEEPASAITENTAEPKVEPASGRVVVVSEPAAVQKNTVSEPVKAVSSVPVAVQTLSVGDDSSQGEAPGTIHRLRWSTSREKIRAVADCSEGTNPEMKVVSGKIAVTFSSVPEGLEGIPSPYDNIKAELTRNAGGGTITFSASGVRVEKLVLDAPRRIVLDFIFSVPTEIRTASQPVQQVPESGGSSVTEAPRKKGKLLVVLDPGHGGKDPGAVANGIKEKDTNLAIGLKMETSLKAKGLDVVMTRRTDVYLKLQERTDIANKANADMFVSIHANALPPGKNSSGFEIYLMAMPTDKDALALAKIENREYVEGKAGNGAVSDGKTEMLMKILTDMQIHGKINESTSAAEVLFKAGNGMDLPMKRVAQAPFFVLRGAMMPAVLLETGFITNAREAKLLAHSGYQQRIADAMANGIHNYLKTVNQ